MKVSEIFIQALNIRDKLKAYKDFPENPIDTSLLPIPPFRISNKIKLIILGQDPTVKKPESREKIEYTLNLDRAGALKHYIKKICNQLEIEFENIYATNIIKYFYSDPPARTLSVLKSHLPENLELLKQEIVIYQKCPILILGQPALQLLAGEKAQVNRFWDYDQKTKQTNCRFDYCHAKDNLLGRDFFPFPHQPSSNRYFYKNTLADYIKFMKKKCRIR